MKNRNMAVSIVAAIFLALLYGMIFSFSNQDGETSGSFSYEITQALVEGLGKILGGNWTEEIRVSLVAYWEHPIRKLGHFSEYAAMGILVYLVWRPHKERNKKLYLLVILWVFVSAALDEGHQLFVPDRCGNFGDVLLDTLGGSFGVFICVMCEKMWKSNRAKTKESAYE